MRSVLLANMPCTPFNCNDLLGCVETKQATVALVFHSYICSWKYLYEFICKVLASHLQTCLNECGLNSTYVTCALRRFCLAAGRSVCDSIARGTEPGHLLVTRRFVSSVVVTRIKCRCDENLNKQGASMFSQLYPYPASWPSCHVRCMIRLCACNAVKTYIPQAPHVCMMITLVANICAVRYLVWPQCLFWLVDA